MNNLQKSRVYDKIRLRDDSKFDTKETASLYSLGGAYFKQGVSPGSYTTSEMLALSSNKINGSMVYNSDLKRLCFYDGTYWQMLGSNYQDTVLPTIHTVFDLASSYTRIDTGFTIEFTALSVSYEIIFDVRIVGTGNTDNFYFAVYDIKTNLPLIGTNGKIFHYHDETDRTYENIRLFTNSLIVGETYNISMYAKADDPASNKLTWTGFEDNSDSAQARFAIKPLYHITTF